MALTPSEKVKRWRARQRAGLVVLRVECDMAALVDWMVNRGDLDPTDAIDDPVAVGEALSRAVAVWTRS